MISIIKKVRIIINRGLHYEEDITIRDLKLDELYQQTIDLNNKIDKLYSEKEDYKNKIKELLKKPEPINVLDFKDQIENKYEDEKPWLQDIHSTGVKVDVCIHLRNSMKDKLLLKEAVNNIFNNRNTGSPEKIIEGLMSYFCIKKNWTYDNKERGLADYWELAKFSLINRKGDCVDGDEEIITCDGLIKVRDLKVGDKVLSFDFNNNKSVYKPITNIINKGIMNIKEVEFRNRQKIKVTANHPMLVRKQQKKSEYHKQYLSDIDVSKWWKRKVPCFKHIDNIRVCDKKWLNDNLCFIIGHFCAEGFVEGSHVRTCGYEVKEFIIPLLESENVPYSLCFNKKDLPIITFLKSNFKDFLSCIKNDSFNIILPEWFKYLPNSCIRQFLKGYFLGDGHYHNKKTRVKVYSTSSENLASDIAFMSLRIGEPLYCYKQLKHCGNGNNPIWRLEYNPNSHFNKDFGYDNISEVSIKNIIDAGKKEVFDFTVADTHNFVFKNGIITHNCDDLAILMYCLIITAFEVYGFKDHVWRLKLAGVNTLFEGHLVNVWLGPDLEWYVVESTLDLRGSFKKTWLKTPVKNNNLYSGFFGFARDDRSWLGDHYRLDTSFAKIPDDKLIPDGIIMGDDIND